MNKFPVFLKGGKQATLILSLLPINDDYQQYSITALSPDNKVIANCRFNMVSIYSHELSMEKRLSFAKRVNKPLELTLSSIIIRVKTGEEHKYVIEGNTLVRNNRIYIHERTFCQLNKIEIYTDEYFKVGLGTAMLKLLEEIALHKGAEYIEALFYPLGKFESGSHDFYRRNNFSFVSRGGSQTYVIKELKALNTEDLK